MIFTTSDISSSNSLPSDLRAPFGWPFFSLLPDCPVELQWAPPRTCSEPGGWLRVTTGIDDREFKRIEVRLPKSEVLLGTFDLRFAHALEPFQLWIAEEHWPVVLTDGVTLTLVGPVKRPLWLLGAALPVGALALSPHLLPVGNETTRVDAFFDRLGSLVSLQPFGWMEGCVLDALHDLSLSTGSGRWSAVRDSHLELFVGPGGRLIYEDPGSRPADDEIRCIEETLPFAVLAKVAPGDPLLELALNYWDSITREDGSVEAGDRLVSCEGSYTIAYPMAAIARQRGDFVLAERAARQLRIRRDLLRRPDGLWLRYWRKDAERHYRSWARGVAWYLLGLARSLVELRGLVAVAELEDELREAADWVLKWQRADGLWGCFLDDGTMLPDTSGSAGIAAALALGARHGVLAEGAFEAGRRTWEGLQCHLTPDGFLAGAAQSNRGGEALQRSDYRVLSPMGMGLMGQLAAALGVSPR